MEPFSNGLAKYWDERRKKFGLVDRTGRVVRGAEFNSVGNFVDRLAPVRRDNGPAFITPSGDIAFELEADGIADFSEGLAAVRDSGKYGFINTAGQIAIKYQFAEAGAFSEGLAPVKIKGTWGYIDRAGKMVIPARFSRAFQFVDGRLIGSEGGVVLHRSDGRRRAAKRLAYGVALPVSDSLVALLTGNPATSEDPHLASIAGVCPAAVSHRLAPAPFASSPGSPARNDSYWSVARVPSSSE